MTWIPSGPPGFSSSTIVIISLQSKNTTQLLWTKRRSNRLGTLCKRQKGRAFTGPQRVRYFYFLNVINILVYICPVLLSYCRWIYNSLTCYSSQIDSYQRWGNALQSTQKLCTGATETCYVSAVNKHWTNCSTTWKKNIYLKIYT